MIKILRTNSKNFERELNILLSQRNNISEAKISFVRKIINNIRKNGDKSLIKYEKTFNNIKKLKNKNLTFSKSEIKYFTKQLNPKIKKAIDIAYQRISNFHKNQKIKTFQITDKFKNKLFYRSRPIDKIGIYVPGGKASYPSSVLMNCIPAIIAGVNEIYMTVPSLNNKINAGVLYAATKCKVKKIYKIGGAQAIAAFAYGTKTIKKVDKIIGPGNEYVSLAKKEVFGQVGIDIFAGPSEITIIADKYSNPEWISADLIAQAEHDEMAQSILVTNNDKLVIKVKKLIFKQLKSLPKKKIVQKSFNKNGILILAKNNREIVNIVNQISPEHLEIYTKKPNIFLNSINNAGSIFLGGYSPEAMGDYLAGPNHVLPTSGTAKFSSGLSVYDFIKRQSIIKISKSGIERLGSSVINLSKYENLHGHANSVKIRMKKG